MPAAAVSQSLTRTATLPTAEPEPAKVMPPSAGSQGQATMPDAWSPLHGASDKPRALSGADAPGGSTAGTLGRRVRRELRHAWGLPRRPNASRAARFARGDARAARKSLAVFRRTFGRS